MNDIANEQKILFSEIPAWCGKNIGKRVSKSAVHRWRLRGARGRKLETVQIDGLRYTSQEALLRFFRRAGTGAT